MQATSSSGLSRELLLWSHLSHLWLADVSGGWSEGGDGWWRCRSHAEDQSATWPFLPCLVVLCLTPQSDGCLPGAWTGSSLQEQIPYQGSFPFPLHGTGIGEMLWEWAPHEGLPAKCPGSQMLTASECKVSSLLKCVMWRKFNFYFHTWETVTNQSTVWCSTWLVLFCVRPRCGP